MAITIPETAFSGTLQVAEVHLDELQHVNNVVYLQWVQQIAAAHWVSLTSEEARSQWAWVVRRHEIDYLRPCRLGDQLNWYTWVLPPQGLVFPRMVTFQHANTGKLAAQACTHWQLIDPQSQRGIALPPKLLQLFFPEMG